MSSPGEEWDWVEVDGTFLMWESIRLEGGKAASVTGAREQGKGDGNEFESRAARAEGHGKGLGFYSR